MPRRSRVGNRISTWWISRYAGVRYARHAVGVSRLPARAVRPAAQVDRVRHRDRAAAARGEDEGCRWSRCRSRPSMRPITPATFTAFRDTLRVIKLVFFSPLWVLAFLVAASCAHAPAPLPALLPASPAWQTMRAEHRVTVEAGGQRRTLRGLIAVQRPDRFRLRALGPAGLTLFDVVVGGRAGAHHRGDQGSATRRRWVGSCRRWPAICQAAYDLLPRPPERTITRAGRPDRHPRKRTDGARDAGAHRHRQHGGRLRGARRRRQRRQGRGAGSGVVGEVESAAT